MSQKTNNKQNPSHLIPYFSSGHAGCSGELHYFSSIKKCYIFAFSLWKKDAQQIQDARNRFKLWHRDGTWCNLIGENITKSWKESYPTNYDQLLNLKPAPWMFFKKSGLLGSDLWQMSYSDSNPQVRSPLLFRKHLNIK